MKFESGMVAHWASNGKSTYSKFKEATGLQHRGVEHRVRHASSAWRHAVFRGKVRHGWRGLDNRRRLRVLRRQPAQCVEPASVHGLAPLHRSPRSREPQRRKLGENWAVLPLFA